MKSEVSGKLIGELRGQVNDLAAAVQLLTPLVAERGRPPDVGCLANVNKSIYQLIRTICHMELCENSDHIFCPHPDDAVKLCRDLCRETEHVAGQLGIEFDWHADPIGKLHMVDEQLLKLIVFNMLSNAFQAAGEGGRVQLRCNINDKWLTVIVSDSGTGLKPPREDENPLLKTDGGMGFGLEAARRAASLHGGKLMLESANGVGVSAVLSLPVRKPGKKELVEQGEERKMRYDLFGGYSPLLVEFSPQLGREDYLPENVE